MTLGNVYLKKHAISPIVVRSCKALCINTINTHLRFGVSDLESRFQDNEGRPHSCYTGLPGMNRFQNSVLKA